MTRIKIDDLQIKDLIETKVSYLELTIVVGGDGSPGSNPPWDGWYKNRPPIVW